MYKIHNWYAFLFSNDISRKSLLITLLSTAKCFRAVCVTAAGIDRGKMKQSWVGKNRENRSHCLPAGYEKGFRESFARRKKFVRDRKTRP